MTSETQITMILFPFLPLIHSSYAPEFNIERL
mgnify:CR=1 FL=1